MKAFFRILSSICLQQITGFLFNIYVSSYNFILFHIVYQVEFLKEVLLTHFVALKLRKVPLFIVLEVKVQVTK